MNSYLKFTEWLLLFLASIFWLQAVLNMQVPVEHAKEVNDCKHLIKTLVMGMHNLLALSVNFCSPPLFFFFVFCLFFLNIWLSVSVWCSYGIIFQEWKQSYGVSLMLIFPDRRFVLSQISNLVTWLEHLDFLFWVVRLLYY